MRKTRIIPERDKKPKIFTNSLKSSHRTNPQTWDITSNVCNILHTIDYDKKLIKNLLQ